MTDAVSVEYAALWTKFVADVCAQQPWKVVTTAAQTKNTVHNIYVAFIQSMVTQGYLKNMPTTAALLASPAATTYDSGVASKSQAICDISSTQKANQYVIGLYMSQNGLTGTVPAKLQAGRDAVAKFNDAYATMYADKDKRKVITDQLAADIVKAGFASLDEFYTINQAFKYV